MKKIILYFFFATISISNLFSQRQADNWVWGLCTPGNGCPEPFGSGILKFNNTGLESIISSNFQYRINKGSASISDSAGNLLLVFNGKYLFDSTGAIIDSFYLGDFSEMPVGFKNSLFLNVPNKPDKYCLFNSYWNPVFDNSFFLGFDSSFYYSEFKTTDSEIETIIRKQPIELDSSAAGTIAACRHANGRDWWIMKSSVYQDKFYQALLDPTGFEFNAIYSPVPHVHQPGAGWNLFSSNGDKFVNVIIGSVRKAFIYDFDRCDGTLNNPIEYDLSNYFNEDVANACCLSPDGTKLYFRRSNLNSLYSIELCQYDFSSSTFSVIAEGHSAPALTPNNLWVVSGFIDSSVNPILPTISVIYQPNQIAENCSLLVNVYDMINYGFIDVSPNYANFRLGALIGSGCDTLSTSINKVNSRFNLNIYPNPTELSLTIEIETSSLGRISIIDMLGRNICNLYMQNQKITLTKEIELLKNGIYWVELHDIKTGEKSRKKFIKK